MDSDDLDDLATSPTPPKRRKVVAVLAPRPSMADLLASFGAVKSPTSATKLRRESTTQQNGEMRSSRNTKQPIPYAESPPSTPRSAGGSSNSSYADALETPTAGDNTTAETSEDELTSDDVIHAVPRGTAAKYTTPSISIMATLIY